MAERQRLEREAQRVQHFAQLGQLAAGVSHEIRNPLSAVFLHVDLLSEELQQPTPDSPAVLDEALAEIKTNLGRVEDLVQDYLTLVRVGTLELTPEDLGGAVQAWATGVPSPERRPWRGAPVRRARGARNGCDARSDLTPGGSEPRAECA